LNGRTPLPGTTEMAQSNRLKPDGCCVSWLRVQSSVGPFDRLLVATGDQVSQGEAALERPTARVNGAQSNCPLERLDRWRRSVRKRVRPPANAPRVSRIGIERKRPLDRSQAGSALAG